MFVDRAPSLIFNARVVLLRGLVRGSSHRSLQLCLVVAVPVEIYLVHFVLVLDQQFLVRALIVAQLSRLKNLLLLVFQALQSRIAFLHGVRGRAVPRYALFFIRRLELLNLVHIVHRIWPQLVDFRPSTLVLCLPV